MTISVVIPCYRTEHSLEELYTRLRTVFLRMSVSYEIIFVNDASPEGDWELIQRLVARDASVRGIDLYRNFGQQRAIRSGLEYAKGDLIVVMDGDLQDAPEGIAILYQHYCQEGYKAVFAIRSGRKDCLGKRMTSALFNRIYGMFSGRKFPRHTGNFSLVDAKLVRNALLLPYQGMPYKHMIAWCLPSLAFVSIAHEKRPRGKSAYTWKKRWEIAGSILVFQSSKILSGIVALGGILTFAALLILLVILCCQFLGGFSCSLGMGLLISQLFLSGLVLSAVGVVGLYVGGIFEQVKKKPAYLVREVISQIKSTAGQA